MKTIFLTFICVVLTSCTFYTEKRSEALSQAVFATSDSINAARFDLASKYSKESERLAYPPKKRIKIEPIITKNTVSYEVENKTIYINQPNLKNPNEIKSNIIKKQENNQSGKSENQVFLRLVVPENLKHAKLLIENSDEWKELLKTKEFSERLEKDHQNLQKLASDIDLELQKQNQMNNKMVQELNNMQKKLVEKDLAILKRNIIIVVLLLSIGGATYLRIKGIL
jgi:hypothetical protein